MFRMNQRVVPIVASFVIMGTLALFYTNTAPVNEYQLACSEKKECREIVKAMRDGTQLDSSSSSSPLVVGEILDLAANRLGYGLSPVDQVFLPDKIKQGDIYKIAWIIYSQIYKDDPTLRGINPANLLRQKQISVELSRKALDREYNECLNDNMLKYQGEFNFALMPTQMLNEQHLRLRKIVRAILPETNRTVCQRNVSVRMNRLMLDLTAEKELLESVFSSQYGADGRTQDLQMNYQKKIHEFWFNHFNIDTQKAGRVAMGRESYENLITQYQNSSFRQLLGAVIKSPGMLIYLDNDENYFVNNSASNQNLGREMMELHTFGVGPRVVDSSGKIIRWSPYNQIDIEVASTVLTGHSYVNIIDGSGVHRFGYKFTPARSFLANTASNNYQSKFWSSRSADQRPLFFSPTHLKNLDALSPDRRLDYVLDQLARHPVTAQNICHKFNRGFVAKRDILPTIVDNCKSIYNSTSFARGTQLQNIYHNLVSQPVYWTRVNARKILANPVEVVIKNVRTAGLNWGHVYSTNPNQSKLSNLSKFMISAINEMGIDYRNYGPPTGYPTLGYRWLSKGYLMSHARLSMDYAQLDRKIGISTTAERKFTRQSQILDKIDAIPSMNGEQVANVIYGSVRGIASVRPEIPPHQVAKIKALVNTKQSGQWDSVNTGATFQKSLADTILGLGKTSVLELRK